MMRTVVREGTGVRANIPELNIAGKTGTGQKSSARGYQEKYIASFIGFFPAEKPRYSGLILFDEPEDGYGGGSAAAPVFGEFVQSILPVIESRKAGEEIPFPEVKSAQSAVPENLDLLSDFRGLSARDALMLARAHGIPARLNGSGYVKGQTPEPGTKIKDVRLIVLDLDF